MNEKSIILIIDDMPASLVFFSAILMKKGFIVRTADSGESGLLSILAQPPDLILLDICMPDMDGFEVCRRINENPSTCDIPIIFVTALTELEDRVKGLELGAIDYITKPLQIKECLARINTHIEMSRLRLLLKKQTSELENMNEKLQTELNERKHSEEILRENEHKFFTVFKSSPNAMSITSAIDGKYVNVNDIFLKDSGYSRDEVIGHTSEELQMYYDHSDRELITSQVREHGHVYNKEIRFRMKTGEILTCLISTSFISMNGQPYFLSIIVNITDQKRLEEEHRKMELQIQHTEKLESLGILAGGIAHDFNNLLSGIFGYIELAKKKSTEKQIIDYLTKAVSTIDRARGLTQQLLTFAKGGNPVRKTGRLFPFIQEVVVFALSGSNVAWSIDIPVDLWPCEFDRTQIAQCIDNLVINARHAMPTGGTIFVSASNVILNENKIATLPEGCYVKIAIQDNGTGISQEILPRIFDPFFTTKQKGSGLGLSTCFSVIKKHDGLINVESQPGNGTTFYIYLPALPGVKIEEAERK